MGDEKNVVEMRAHLMNADEADRLGGEEETAPPPPKEPTRATAIKLPKGSPVVPLGWQEGEFYYLDARGSLRILSPSQFKAEQIQSLFAPQTARLVEYWPNLKNQKNPITGEDEWVATGWKTKEAGETLMNVAAQLPPWDPSRKLRGRGTWIDDDGNLVHHAGDWLYRPGKKRIKPGFIEGYLYPKRADGVHPGEAKAAQSGLALLENLISKWNFQRGEDAVRLVLGHIISQLVCGALDFRPALYLTGDRGSGKTTLMETMMTVSNGIYTGDASAAGVYQATRDNAQPVALDETETDVDRRKQTMLLKLMRSCSSGDLILRGSGEHRSVSFQARSAIVFGSITPLQMSPADYSRMPVLEIGVARGRLSMPTDAELKKAGADILALLLERWSDFLQRVETWRLALMDAGHDARGADAYGYLLGGLCFVEAPDTPPPAGQIAHEAKRFAVQSAAENEDESMGVKCLDLILTYPAMMSGRNTRQHIFEIIQKLCGDDFIEQEERRTREKHLDTTLRQHGLCVMVQTQDAAGNVSEVRPLLGSNPATRKFFYLAIANNHSGLVRLFDATENPWRTAHGSAQSGWKPALKRLDYEPYYATAHRQPIGFGSKASRAILISIDHILDENK